MWLLWRTVKAKFLSPARCALCVRTRNVIRQKHPRGFGCLYSAVFGCSNLRTNVFSALFCSGQIFFFWFSDPKFNLLNHHHHYHHWLDSPWWALTFLRNFVHSSLLREILFQFLTSNILMSWSISSSHRSFGLPTLLTPSGLALNIFLMVLSLFTRTRCPVHANLLTLTL